MATHLNIAIPDELFQRLEARVSAGHYASADEMVVDGLLRIEEADRCAEENGDADRLAQWLRTEAPAQIAYSKAHPEELMSLQDFRRELEQEFPPDALS